MRRALATCQPRAKHMPIRRESRALRGPARPPSTGHVAQEGIRSLHLHHSPTYSLPAPLKGILVDTMDTNTPTLSLLWLIL